MPIFFHLQPDDSHHVKCTANEESLLSSEERGRARNEIYKTDVDTLRDDLYQAHDLHDSFSDISHMTGMKYVAI